MACLKSAFRPARHGWLLLVAVMVLLAACSSKPVRTINLMPAPEIYTDGTIDPFDDEVISADTKLDGILYATNRYPAVEIREDHFYQDKRGSEVRLGVANIAVGHQEITWEEARRISLAKNRPGNYPLKIASVDEFGILDTTINDFTPPEFIRDDPAEPRRQFVTLVEDKLAKSKHRDIYVYVHGYKVVFENPVLVTAELWHFLGYDGVAIAFSWPSTPKRTAYFADLETTTYSSFHLRHFLKFLADRTSAERIHIVGYSAGTRVVLNTLAQMAMESSTLKADQVSERYRIGNVILVGSDFDRDVFGAFLVDGLLRVPEAMTIQVSSKDKALDLSRFFFWRKRLGQGIDTMINPQVRAYLERNDKLVFLDVTYAEGSTDGNGHAYFRSSPWVSSDILMTLYYNLRPEQRGLVRKPDSPVWTFPQDYTDQLRRRLQLHFEQDRPPAKSD